MPNSIPKTTVNLWRFHMRLALAFILLIAPLHSQSQAADTSAESLRAVVQNGIQFVEAKGVYWIESKKCVSCHRIGNMTWSLLSARSKGLQVSEQLDEWLTWSNEDLLRKNDKGKIVGTGNKTGVVQIILSNALADSDTFSALTKKLTPLLLTSQNEDGSWKPGGQLPSQKRAKEETTQVTTMWIALALVQNTPATKPPAELTKALNYLDGKPEGKSAEWFLARYMLAKQQGQKDTQASTIASLLKFQQDNGGWGWNLNEASDALATGMALYALSQAAPDSRIDSAITRAQEFLVTTQSKDGSWKVNGTKANKRDTPIETSVFWGASWAVLGLAETLPD